GSYAVLTINKREVAMMKNGISFELSPLFSSIDYRQTSCQVEDNESRNHFCYTTTIAIMRKRLKILGYTLDQAKEIFETSEFYDLNQNCYASYSFEQWQEAVSSLFEKYNHVWEMNLKFDNGVMYTPIEKSLTDESNLLGFSDDDLCIYLISLFSLDCFDDEDEIILDISDLYESGWIEQPEKIFDSLFESITEKNRHFNKVIVLAEGVSDIEIIQISMKIRYPEFYNLYGFMDFKSAKLGGSASGLVNIIKSFIAAGISNKIIALFDNDTAAYDATKKLKEQQLPKNITILHYPDLEIAKSYPTIGPNGLEHLNINSLACSIEMYLGDDILRDEEGNLSPIQWTGFNASLNQYQGEILGKKKIQEKYSNFLVDCLNLNGHDDHDWTAMDLLLEKIFDA
ncbi:hypothetical protein E3O82_002508, partial [Enterococcus faecalis]|nr:hypothetical protein [Enterococcus faecalis]